jgi:hypothetical protein
LVFIGTPALRINMTNMAILMPLSAASGGSEADDRTGNIVIARSGAINMFGAYLYGSRNGIRVGVGETSFGDLDLAAAVVDEPGNTGSGNTVQGIISASGDLTTIGAFSTNQLGVRPKIRGARLRGTKAVVFLEKGAQLEQDATLEWGDNPMDLVRLRSGAKLFGIHLNDPNFAANGARAVDIRGAGCLVELETSSDFSGSGDPFVFLDGATNTHADLAALSDTDLIVGSGGSTLRHRPPDV